LQPSLRDEVYRGYSEGDLERSTFPFRGDIVNGLIYDSKEVVYLIPVSTIVAGRSGSFDDDDESFDIEVEKVSDREETN